MINVTLSNKECIFDSATGFKSVEKALEWASGRGDTYVIQLERDDVCGAFISLDAKSDNEKTTYSYYDGWEWREVAAENIKGLL